MSATAVLVKALTQAVRKRVSTVMPDPEPEEFIIVSRIGGGADDWATRNPRFLVECYAHSEFAAEQLGERVWELWPTLRDGTTIMWASRDNNLARNPDPDPKLHRFQFTATLQLRPTS